MTTKKKTKYSLVVCKYIYLLAERLATTYIQLCVVSRLQYKFLFLFSRVSNDKLNTLILFQIKLSVSQTLAKMERHAQTEIITSLNVLVLWDLKESYVRVCMSLFNNIVVTGIKNLNVLSSPIIFTNKQQLTSFKKMGLKRQMLKLMTLFYDIIKAIMIFMYVQPAVPSWISANPGLKSKPIVLVFLILHIRFFPNFRT